MNMEIADQIYYEIDVILIFKSEMSFKFSRRKLNEYIFSL